MCGVSTKKEHQELVAKKIKLYPNKLKLCSTLLKFRAAVSRHLLCLKLANYLLVVSVMKAALAQTAQALLTNSKKSLLHHSNTLPLEIDILLPSIQLEICGLLVATNMEHQEFLPYKAYENLHNLSIQSHLFLYLLEKIFHWP